MSSQRDETIDLVGNLVREGRIGGQVSQFLITLDPKMSPTQAQDIQDAHERTIERLIGDGTLAWKVANSQPGRPKVLYSPEPINPQTGRAVSAYLWMTPLAVVRYGAELYELYRASVEDRRAKYPQIDPPLDTKAFETKLLRDTVAVAPSLAHLVPGNVLAATCPKTKAKARSGGKTAAGHVAVLGPRNSNEIIFNHSFRSDGLDKLDRWNVGPETRLTNPRDKVLTGPGGDGYIERMALTCAGVDGLTWLVKKGFVPNAQWYAYVLGLAEADSVPLLDAIYGLGVDPRAVVDEKEQNTLWHCLVNNTQIDEGQVAWLKAHEVDWGRADISGRLPLARLLNKVNYEMDTWSLLDAPAGMGSFGSLLGMIPGLGNAISQDLSESKKRVARLADLAVEMVASGVDPLRPALDGSFAWQAIVPSQERAMQKIAEQLPADETDPEKAIMRELFFGDRQDLLEDRSAYSQPMLDFIGRMEHAYGRALIGRRPARPKM